MAEFVCEHCGKTFTGGNISYSYRFCSKSCAALRRANTYDGTLDWKFENGRWQCPYNEGVACRNRVFLAGNPLEVHVEEQRKSEPFVWTGE